MIDSSAIHSFHIELFGAGIIQIGGERMPPLKYRKEFWLLAYLALHPDRDVDRNAVAALFWPDNEEELALYYLRRSLSHLRRALGPEAYRLLTPSQRTLRLDLSEAFCDVVAFDHAVTSSSPDRLEQAVTWYRGLLLAGCVDEWVLPERQRREQAYLEALEKLAQAARERGEPGSASRWLRLLIIADPYRESAYSALMQALADSGDHAALQQVYQELRLVLRRDLNIGPAPETEALYRSLRGRASQPVVLPPATSMPSGPPRRLPIPLSDLIGREQELEEVCGWLDKRRLVTLVGTGGVGKTRLSIAAAEQVIGRFAEGVWFVDLAPLSDPAQVIPTILRLFDLREESHDGMEETLERALSSRTLLLILDNCEHLLEACAALTHRLLKACPGMRVLATSRETLGLTGEHAYRVPSLSLPPRGQTEVEKETSSLLEYGAVRLFVERAKQSSSTFQLNRLNVGMVVQICRHLDGIPLGIEMASARVKSLSMAQIAARLEDRFQLLTGGSRAALPRQRTLQATLDWSHDLLTEAERALFRRLSVFSGGWTLEAAEQVCSVQEEEVLDLLTSLVDKSLAVFEESAEGMARYHLLESMRQYGVERLAEAGEREALQHQHRDFFLQWSEEAEPYFYGPEQSAWYAYVDNEYENLRTALEWCQREKNAEKALRLAGALSAFWDVRGYHKEGLAHQIAALSLAGAAGTAARAKVLLAAGQLSARQPDFALATALLEECLTLQRELGNRRGVGGTLNELADVAFRQGDHRLARAHCEESLAIAQELGDRPSAVGALNILGQLCCEEGSPALARSFYEKCLTIQRELGDTRGIAGSLRGLGNVAYDQKDPPAARSLYEESLAIDRELGDRRGIMYTLGRLGHLARAEGDYGHASSRYQECLALHWELGDVSGMILSLEDFAILAARQGQHERVARLLGAAKALCQTLGRTPHFADPEEYARTVDTARAALGKEAFEAAWEKGREMSPGQMVEYALTGAPDAPR